MKKVILFLALSAAIVLAGVVTSCGSKSSDNPQQTDEAPATNSDDEVVYACPMHPEITGKAGDECSKCGMALEKVEDDHDHDHDDHQ